MVSAIFNLRRDTALAWANKNPVLRPGEPGLAIDTGTFKLGDGIRAWTALPAAAAAEVAEAQMWAEAAEDSAGDAAVSANAADGFRVLAQNARDAAVAARDITLGYRDTTLGYRNEAEGFKNSAAASAASAAGAVTTAFNGSDLGAANLNTIITPGFYWQANPANATLALNYPVAERSSMEVLAGGSGASRFITQRVTVLAGSSRYRDQWYRRWDGSAWEAWSRVSSLRTTVGGNGHGVWAWNSAAVAESRLLPIGMALGSLDLNTVTTPGQYQQVDQSQGTLARNYPQAGVSGSLEVLDVNGTGDVTQRFTPHRGGTGRRGLWQRSLISGTGWSAWGYTPQTSTVQPSGQPGVEMYMWDEVNGVARRLRIDSIPLGTANLNSVLAFGDYYADNPTAVTLANNYPVVGVQGTLEVFNGNNSTTGHFQRFTPHVGAPRSAKVFYQRSYIAAGWQPWQAFTTTREVNPGGQPGGEMFTWGDASNSERQLQTISTPLGTTNLDVVTVAGTYIQGTGASATVANNYPFEGATGLLEVFRVTSAADANLMQRLSVVWNTPHGGRGIYERVKFGSGTAWGAWRFIPTERIDKTAGLAIYTWDPASAREQIVYGDTGRRNINTLITLPTGAVVSGGNNWIVRRYGTMVTLELADGLEFTTGFSYTAFMNLPVGFRPFSYDRNPIFSRSGASTVGMIQPLPTGDVRIMSTGSTATITTGMIARWDTLDAWPTSLPGTAVGTIPNL